VEFQWNTDQQLNLSNFSRVESVEDVEDVEVLEETLIPLCGMGEFGASLKTPEKLAIRAGRCCLFSITYVRF